MMEELATSGKKQMKFQSGGVAYDAKDAVIQGADDALNAIVARFEAMSIDS